MLTDLKKNCFSFCIFFCFCLLVVCTQLRKVNQLKTETAGGSVETQNQWLLTPKGTVGTII